MIVFLGVKTFSFVVLAMQKLVLYLRLIPLFILNVFDTTGPSRVHLTLTYICVQYIDLHDKCQ